MIEKYTIYCTPEQTKKALGLGAPLKVVTCHSRLKIDSATKGKNRDEYTLVDNFQQPGEYWCKVITNPTAEQMIGWIESICSSEIRVFYIISSWEYNIFDNYSSCVDVCCGYLSRKEATLAAIDAALDHLAKNKKQL